MDVWDHDDDQQFFQAPVASASGAVDRGDVQADEHDAADLMRVGADLRVRTLLLNEMNKIRAEKREPELQLDDKEDEPQPQVPRDDAADAKV
ncbi:hypothetical protein PR202_gb21027 [Eleusine coracana subsp. coracana]|uniref:Uncharacterized protein n=1 Tax=Eleusine coracana subsp. coracana TaxID=191504 RepID=A0AAV5FCY2_ELECO|nr:hypothetical protein PR202_gb21027 [Eleusine coracana subsp. coracana]